MASAAAAAAEVEASLEVPADPHRAAFFDVDNTMMQGASIFHFARGLAARDFFTWRDLASFGWQQVWFRVRGVEDPAHMEEAKQAALGFVAGHTVEEVVRLGEEIYDDLMADRIWSGTRALAQLHLDAGQRVWLVTAAPTELASLLARRLGLTGALGTVSEVKTAYTPGDWSASRCTVQQRPKRFARSQIGSTWTCRNAPRTPTPPTTYPC